MARFLLSAALAVLLVPAIAGLSLTFEAPKEATCSAYGSISIRQLGPGRCTASVGVSCEVHAHGTAQIVSAISKLFEADDLCAVTEQSVASAGIAVADALAKSFSQALAQVQCIGVQGFGCGYGISESRAWALAYANSISLAIAEAESPSSQSRCVARLEAISEGIASALTFALGNACVSGTGTAEAFSESFAQASVSVFAETWAAATAAACGSTGQCLAQGSGTSDINGAAVFTSGTQGNAISTDDTQAPSSATATSTFVAQGNGSKPKSCIGGPTIGCCFKEQGCPPGWVLFETNTPGPHRIFVNPGVASCSCPF
ncbi:hypothetical protein BSKO_04123 [Bryopsis sp. KO-2023]|nr:hypothetical protein BSKO_04123 [Bryopsis sp. KO-2023]